MALLNIGSSRGKKIIVVAQNLHDEAIRRRDEYEVNWFGRSVFNRYYYATFLIIREFVATVDEGWGRTPHANLPELIRTTILRRIRRELQRNVNARGNARRLNYLASTSASNLANLLEEAYAVRTTADYNPDVECVKNNGVIEMGRTKSSEAAQWPVVANRDTKQMLKVCKRVGIV